MYRYALSFPSARIPNQAWTEAIQTAKLKRLELACAPNCLDPYANFNGKVMVLAQKQSQNQLEISSLHMPFGNQWNLSELTPDLRTQHVRRCLTFLRITEPLKCRHITFHAAIGSLTTDQKKLATDALKRSLDDILPKTQAMGVTLNLELLPNENLPSSPEELSNILDDYPPELLGACLDVNHLGTRAQQVDQAIKFLGTRINTFHLSDYDGIDECHWYPFLGILPWDKIMAEIKRLPQDPLLVLETDGFLRPPLWQKRKVTENMVFRAAEHNVYLLEHAEEIARGRQELIIP